MQKILLISFLGVLGVLSRHLLETRFGNKGELLPLGTFLANILGCFAAGLVYQYMTLKTNNQEIASIVLVGFCGGLTTFSGYALTSLNDLHEGAFLKAIAYLLLSPLLGILAAFIGMKVFKLVL
ncbi:MAG: CrcB family protein [Bacteriovoracaceae bacterium]